jgi:hypothetical protein
MMSWAVQGLSNNRRRGLDKDGQINHNSKCAKKKQTIKKHKPHDASIPEPATR